MLALLVLQVVAFPCSIFFGRLAVRYRAEQLILVCILAYFGIALFAMILSTQAQFWVLAVLVGIFQGGVQALSRSYFTKIIPAEQSGEYFGLMDICGKGASFLGTTLVGVVSQATGDIHLGVGVIAVLFAVGAVLFCLAVRVPPEKHNRSALVLKLQNKENCYETDDCIGSAWLGRLLPRDAGGAETGKGVNGSCCWVICCTMGRAMICLGTMHLKK